MPSSTKPAWLQADRRKTKVISSGCTPPSHILSVEEFPYHGHAWHILQVWHSKRPHHVKVTESGCTTFIVLFYFIKIIINRETFAVFTMTLTSFSLAFYKTFILM